MKIDDIRKYVVMVNAGSGCIFQPEDDSCLYVLTAKHNITNENNHINELCGYIKIGDNWRKFNINTFPDTDYYFPHPEKDIAIIKICNIPYPLSEEIAGHDRNDTKVLMQFDKVIRYDEFEKDRDDYMLCGYPKKRRPYADPYRIDNSITILNSKNNRLREAVIPSIPNIDEIIGHSGGPILKINGNHILLVGIQNKMADAVGEELGRIEFSMLAAFDEIVNCYPEALSPLSPPYCKSFQYLKDQVMKLEGCFYEVEHIEKFLQDFTDEIIKNPLTPKAIKNHLSKRLLIVGEHEVSLYFEGLWKAWLELMIVLKVIGKIPKTEKELENIFNQYRVIYSSSTDDWSSLIHKIFRSDFRGLKKNACIIVSNEAKPGKCVIKQGVIKDISRNLMKNEMNIDDGDFRPVYNYKYVHLFAFQQQCVIEKEDEYTGFGSANEAKLLKKLKKEYEKVIKN